MLMEGIVRERGGDVREDGGEVREHGGADPVAKDLHEIADGLRLAHQARSLDPDPRWVKADLGEGEDRQLREHHPRRGGDTLRDFQKDVKFEVFRLVRLSGCQVKVKRMTIAIAQHVDFAGQTTAAAADRVVFRFVWVPFFPPPAAHLAARTVVPSTHHRTASISVPARRRSRPA